MLFQENLSTKKLPIKYLRSCAICDTASFNKYLFSIRLPSTNKVKKYQKIFAKLLKNKWQHSFLTNQQPSGFCIKKRKIEQFLNVVKIFLNKYMEQPNSLFEILVFI